MTNQEQLVEEFVDAFLSREVKDADDLAHIVQLLGQLDSIDPNWRENSKETIFNRVRHWSSPTLGKS